MATYERDPEKVTHEKAFHHEYDQDNSIPDNNESTRHYDNIDEGFDPHQVKQIMRRVDIRLIPILSLMYCISLIDRTNLSLARAANQVQMDRDLGTNIGQRYSIATVIFFIPYIILEVPSQIGLRKFGARWWLGTSTILWGVVMTAMGAVTNWRQLTALRAILGAFEATLFPGAAYLIACWYPRKQMALRNAVFYVMSIVVSGLSAILAWGISQLNGRTGRAGWRWIFIIQGVLTIAIGLLGYLLITDFPDKAKFLSTEERKIVITRIERDRHDSVPDKLTMKKFITYITDPKLWLFGYFFGSTTLGSYSLAYFLPGILQTMGFSNALAQILVAPPYVWVAFPAIFSGYMGDRFKTRAFPIMINATILIIGTCMYSQVSPDKLATRYAGVFLAIGGCNSNVPLIVAWCQTTIRAQSKRGFASALVVAWGGIGGILAGVAFRQQEIRQGYPTGVFLTIGMNAAVVVLAGCLKLYYMRQNKRADRGETILEGNADFRYQH